MKLSLEQGAFLIYAMANFASGMLLTIDLSPQLFTSQTHISGHPIIQNPAYSTAGPLIVWYIILALSIVEFALVLKLDIDGYRYGMIQGVLRNKLKRKK